MAVGLDGGNIHEVKEKAADVGTYAHALAEAVINGVPTPEPPKEFTKEQIQQAQNAYMSFLTWQQHSRLVVVEQEISYVSEELRFGGTPDGIAIVDDKPALLDWKSSKRVYDYYVIQVAAYKHLWEENHPGQSLTGGIHIVRFGKAGAELDHRHIAADNPRLARAWRLFMLYRESYELDKQLKA